MYIMLTNRLNCFGPRSRIRIGILVKVPVFAYAQLANRAELYSVMSKILSLQR